MNISENTHHIPEKILVYCHDLFGIGNIKRMSQFCIHLRKIYPNASILFLLGSRDMRFFCIPDNFDYIKIPEISRSQSGDVFAKTLQYDADSTIRLRSSIIAQVMSEFDPDLLLVDKKPFGARSELEPCLMQLSPRCRRVLVVRDILDAPDATRREMAASGHHAAVRAHYDRVVVLGDREVFDFAAAYALPADIAARLRYTGYLTPFDTPRPRDETVAALGLDPRRKVVLGTAGGGEDGEPLIDAMLSYGLNAPEDVQTVILCGPRLPDAAHQRVAAAAATAPGADRIRVLRESTDVASLKRAADVIVSMAGYNSVCGVLASGRPAILMPRSEPSEEQLVRARLFGARGLAAWLPLGSSGEDLAAAIAAKLAGDAPAVAPDLGVAAAALADIRAGVPARTTLRIADALNPLFDTLEGDRKCSA